MTKLFSKRKKTLMSKKYYSMLLGGTLTMMIVSLLLMSDSIIAGISLGQDAVAGITLVTPMYSIAAFFGSIFSLGIPIVYSKAMGMFDKEEANHAFGFGLLMSIIVGVFLFILVILLGDIYLRSSNSLDGVLESARGYLYWMRFTILLLPLQMLISAVVYSDGDEMLSTTANIVQGLGNIISSILLSQIIGIKGIGLSSFGFNVLAILILLTHFFRKSNSLKWNLYFSKDLLKKVFSYSIIDSSSYLFLGVLIALLNIIISNLFGPAFLITVSVITICRELQMVFDGIGEATTPIFGIYIGEENKDGIKSLYRVAEKSAIIEGIVVTILLVLFADVIPKILNITDEELIRYVVNEVRIIAIGSIFVSLLYLITSYYLVIRKISLGIIISALRDFIFALMLSTILGLIFGIYGVFIGLFLAPVLTYIIVLVFVVKRYGKENWPLFLSKLPFTQESYSFNLEVEPTHIISLQKEIEKLLNEKSCDHKTTGRVKLLIEELYMFIKEKNPDKIVLSECLITIKDDGIQIITKDDGILFDVSEEDINISSIGAFMVSTYMERIGQNRRHLTTISFNRSSFLIKKEF
ncbi:multidrug transporter MatE [bacterium]|nr:multidrug transporter MatE [bacterium]